MDWIEFERWSQICGKHFAYNHWMALGPESSCFCNCFFLKSRLMQQILFNLSNHEYTHGQFDSCAKITLTKWCKHKHSYIIKTNYMLSRIYTFFPTCYIFSLVIINWVWFPETIIKIIMPLYVMLCQGYLGYFPSRPPEGNLEHFEWPLLLDVSPDQVSQ